MCNEDVPKERQGPSQIPPFLTVKQFPQYFAWPSESALRFYIFHAKTNGLQSALLKMGRRVLIDTDEFTRWVRTQGKEKSPWKSS